MPHTKVKSSIHEMSIRTKNSCGLWSQAKAQAQAQSHGYKRTNVPTFVCAITLATATTFQGDEHKTRPTCNG